MISETTTNNALSRDDLVQQCLKRARSKNAKMRKHLQKLAEANKALLGGSIDDSTSATGYATFEMYVIYGDVDLNLTFSDGTQLQFSGSEWGVGLADGVSYGAGSFSVPPAQLIGDCSFQVNFAGEEASGVTVEFWNSSQYLGTFVGGGIGEGVAVAGGSGTWSYA